MSESRNRSPRLQIETSTENTPLNNLNINNQSSAMDADTKRIVIKIAVDIVLLGCGEYNAHALKYF